MQTTKLTKENYALEKDYVIAYECEKCGHYDEDLSEEPVECEKCGSDEIINTTSHEDTNCDSCGKYIDIWEDIYVANTISDKPDICEDCYNDLPEK